MGRPKVSICIPVYNAEKYLRDCLNSVISQSLKDIEIICVNDGSTDGSQRILNEYQKKDKRIIIVNQKNKGLGGARNAGMNRASGKYIGFVDADDVASSKMYEKLYRAAESEKSEMAMCDVKLMGSSKKKKWFNPNTGELTPEFLNKNTQPWNKIVARDLVERTKFKFYKENGDGMYIILMLHANKISTVKEELYNYRVGHSSMSTSYKMRNFEISVESAKEQNVQLQNTQYAKTMKEYFEYRYIYSLIQAITVAALLKEKKLYYAYRKELRNADYKGNKYCKSLLLPELGSVKYCATMYILPINYNLSSLLVGMIMKTAR